MTLPHPRIDAHLHIWDRAVSHYTWLRPDSGELYADFSPADAEAALRSARMDAAVLVQAEDTLRDTEYLLGVADRSSWVAGVVGWVPLDDPPAAEAALERWMRNPAFCGVRQLIHNDPRDALLGYPRVIETLRMIADAGLALDVPDAWPRQLAGMTRAATAVPGLTVVVDHLAKPPIGREDYPAWREALAAAAALPNTVAKLSGLQGGGPALTVDRLRETWDAALELFGPSRLAYGGDWPMTVPHGGYPAVWSVMSALIAELSPSEQGEILGGTAMRVYGIVPPPPID